MTWIESLQVLSVSTQAYWAWILLSFAVGLVAFNLVVAPPPATMLVSAGWLNASATCIEELKKARLSPNASPASWASARSYVDFHSSSIDHSVRLIAEGRALVHSGRLELKSALDELQEARLTAL